MPLAKAPPLPMNCPTELSKARRNHTFITKSSSWEPTILHQDLNTWLVALEPPMA